ncbi:conserved domain protein [Streptococcus infantis X]|uniref:Conserved domain protein n=1 Tax=Streptococcus infantis X TaxID=997830 RepID=F9PBV7_9STRE|nr:conserved domain protein [Streptococcus infantis X]
MDSYQRLLDGTDDRQSDYVKQSIQRFYTEFVESIRDELY